MSWRIDLTSEEAHVQLDDVLKGRLLPGANGATLARNLLDHPGSARKNRTTFPDAAQPPSGTGALVARVRDVRLCLTLGENRPGPGTPGTRRT